MISLLDNVRQDLVTLIPASLMSEVSCFVFYDNHPRDQKNIDVTVCTAHGEVKEYYKRDLINSVIINSSWEPQNIRIFRNNKCQLFYFVSYEDEIAVVSSTDKLQVLHKISNIDTWDVEDSVCRGQARLKIICKDDAVPLYFDDNFEKLGDRSEMFSKENSDDSLPIITQLARKLTEVKYSVKCNEKVLKDLANLRQVAAYSDYKNSIPRESDAVFQENTLEICGPLKIKSRAPAVIVSNKKITIILEAMKTGTLPAENIHILLHCSQASTVYTTKVFEKSSKPPNWIEKLTNAITTNSEYNIIVGVIDSEELKYRVTSKIHLRGVITYKVDSKEYLLPFEDVNLSSLDTMGIYFDTLSTVPDNDNEYKLIAYLATSKKTELCLRVMNKEYKKDEEVLELLNMLNEHLHMRRIPTMSNVVLHNCSPYHILYGVMVVEKEFLGRDKWIITLHTRYQDQIIAFLQYMHDAIPYRIVATSTNQKITSKVPGLAKYNEDNSKPSLDVNYSEYKSSMLKQTSMTLEYLDECMVKMNESKNPSVQSKIGIEIDIFAEGETRFQEFRNKLLKEAATGISSICKESAPEESQGMTMDID